jgi:UPF0755 protein
LIRDSVVFFLHVRQNKLDNKIQAGDFRLSPAMRADKIAELLTTGSIDVWVTIPEGKRTEEIAVLLKESIPTYQEGWAALLAEHEGYLFPDTYLIPKDATIDQIITVMRNNFDTKFASLNYNGTRSQEEIVTVASLIEREARLDEDRPIIASVIYNRLTEPMRLQIDATVQYAIGYDANENSWWKKRLTRDDLQFDSPYNTYTNDGLPPGPICNPGLGVLRAAVSPADTDYLYYITDRTGVNRYARTNAQHEANIERYGL